VGDIAAGVFDGQVGAVANDHATFFRPWLAVELREGAVDT
jgi:hypothetical protein